MIPPLRRSFAGARHGDLALLQRTAPLSGNQYPRHRVGGLVGGKASRVGVGGDHLGDGRPGIAALLAEQAQGVGGDVADRLAEHPLPGQRLAAVGQHRHPDRPAPGLQTGHRGVSNRGIPVPSPAYLGRARNEGISLPRAARRSVLRPGSVRS
jgi:hypothetical protein